MRVLKILLFICFLLIWNKVYSNDHFYTTSNLNNYELNLSQTNIWESYLAKINSILWKYSDDADVLLKLQNRIIELKTNIDVKDIEYTDDIVNLIYYMDLKVYFLLVDLWVIHLWEEEEIKEEIIYPWFWDDYNDSEKNVTAWDDFIILSWKTSSKYESVDVWRAKFYIEGIDAQNLKYSLDYANLYFEWVFISKISPSNIDILNPNKVSLTFDNLKSVIVPQKEVSFRLWIKAKSIWYEKTWKTIKDARVTSVNISDAVWLNSWNKIDAFTTTISVEWFSIVPWVPIISVINDLSNSTVIKLNIRWEFWDSTIDLNNSVPKIEINKLKFSVYDNSNTAIFKLVNTDNTSEPIIWIKSWTILEFDLSSMNENNKTIASWKGEDYEIYISNTDRWLSLDLLKDGLLYDVLWVNWADNLNINMNKSIDLWYRDF